MIFYLGCYRPGWLRDSAVELFLSHRTLRDVRTLPRAACSWALDSGAYTELSRHGCWTFTKAEYLDGIARYAEEAGRLAWAAPRDWMAEPWVRELTGLPVETHLELTVWSVLELRAEKPAVPIIPVLQGWERDDYMRCLALYEEHGIDLRNEPVVGLGSVCRRTNVPEIAELVVELAEQGIRMHGFGVNSAALRRCGYLLESADSLAWSQYARREQRPMLGTCQHKKRDGSPSDCRNCRAWALEWRRRAVASAAMSELRRDVGWQGALL